MFIWHDDAWDEYMYWYKTDKKIFEKLNKLLKEVQRSPFEGLGKPEPLKGNLSGLWSRRLDHEHRLVYRVIDGDIEVAQCRGHY